MGAVEDVLRRQAEALGERWAAVQGPVRLSFAELSTYATRAAAVLNEAGYPLRMPVYVDATDRNWCSSLVSFLGAIVGARIPILAPYGTAPLGPFGRLATSFAAGPQVELLPGEVGELPDYANHFDDPLDIVMSSGSTGRPKAYLFDAAHFVQEAELRAPRHELRALHFGIPFPTSTAAHAIVIRHLLAGVTSIHLPAVESWKTLATEIDKFQPFEVSATPFAMAPLFTPGELSAVACELPRQLRVYAGPLSDTFVGQLQSALPRTRVVSIYGATEGANTTLVRTGAGSQFNLTPADRNVGLWHTDEGRWARTGEIGEILMTSGSRVGPPLLIGEPQGAPALPGGWVATGDLGRLEADGRLTFLGRSSDIIVRQGERHSALALEQAIEAGGWPPVIVFGLADEDGDRLCVLVEGETHPEQLSALRDLTGCVAIMLADPFPRTLLGKIRRRDAIANAVARVTAGMEPAEIAGAKLYDLRAAP